MLATIGVMGVMLALLCESFSYSNYAFKSILYSVFVVVAAFWVSLLRLRAGSAANAFWQSFALCLVFESFLFIMTILSIPILNPNYDYSMIIHTVQFFPIGNFIDGIEEALLFSAIGFVMARLFARWALVKNQKIPAPALPDFLRVFGIIGGIAALSILIISSLERNLMYSSVYGFYFLYFIVVSIALPLLARYDSLQVLHKQNPVFFAPLSIPAMPEMMEGQENGYASGMVQRRPVYSQRITVALIVLFSIAALSIFFPSYAEFGVGVLSSLSSTVINFQSSIMPVGIGIVLAAMTGLIAAIIAVTQARHAADPTTLLRGFAGTALGATIIGVLLSIIDMVQFINFVSMLNDNSNYGSATLLPGIFITLALFIVCGILASVQLAQLNP